MVITPLAIGGRAVLVELVGGSLKHEPDIEVRRLFLEQEELLAVVGREIALSLDDDAAIHVEVFDVLGLAGGDNVRVLIGFVSEWYASVLQLSGNAVLQA